MSLLFRAYFSLWKRVHWAPLVGLSVLPVAVLLAACDDGPQTERPTQPTQIPGPTATPTPTPEPTPTSTDTPTPTVETNDMEGCEDVLTKEHSLRAIFTDENLMRCLHEGLQ